MTGRPVLPGVPLRGILARWDAVAIRWGLAADERSALLGGMAAGPVGDVATYATEAAEDRMRLLVALDPVLAAVHGDEDRTRDWLRRPNATLGGSTPLDLMASSPEWIRWLVGAVGAAS